MADYVLAVGVNHAAPAAGAPEHMAAWLEAHGYHVVHDSKVGHRPKSVASVPGRAGRMTAAAKPRFVDPPR